MDLEPLCLSVTSGDPAFKMVLLVCLGLVFLISWSIRNLGSPGYSYLLVANLAMFWWLASTGAEIASGSEYCKILWSKAGWPAKVVMTTAWALFLYGYARNKTVNKTTLRVLFYLMPLLLVAILATNNLHQLFYGPDTKLVVSDTRSYVVYDHGPLFFLSVGYVYCLILLSIAIAVIAVIRASQVVRVFFLKLLLITALPVAGNFAHLFGGFRIFDMDPTPFLFSADLAAIVWLIASNRWVDVQAIARELLFYNSKNAVFIVYADGTLCGVNPKAQEIWGGDLPKIGQSIENNEELGPIFASRDEFDKTDETKTIQKKGRSFTPRVYSILSAPSEQNLGWLIELSDITEMQKAASVLYEAAEEARSTDRAKTEFLATVSHELRSPMTSIKGSLDLMKSIDLAASPEKTNDLIEIASRNANRLINLINELLDLQKIESGLADLILEPLDLAELVRESVETMKHYNAGKTVALSLSIRDQPVMVRGDYQRLLQVMANLISNAMKFSKDDGVVEVELVRQGSTARIKVTDYGSGIPEGSENAVFGRFTQVDGSASQDVSQGTGLGLSITRSILKSHNAVVRYESELGAGTVFFVEIPALDVGVGTSPA